MLSDCCDATVLGEIIGFGEDAFGICSQCREWMGCYDEDALEE